MPILHISYDYCETKNSAKTSAVGAIVEYSRSIDEAIVLNLERTVSIINESLQVQNNHVYGLKTFGLPYGIFLQQTLNRTANKIIKYAQTGILDLSEVSLIHAHKLTFEGYIGFKVAEELNVPLLISLRNTDLYVLKYRPDFLRSYKKVLRYASQIFHIAPYMVEEIRALAGDSFFFEHIKPKLRFLPNKVVRKNSHLSNPIKGEFLTAFRMTKRYTKLKNVRNLFKAISMLKEDKFKLTIVGGGPYLDEVKNFALKLNVNDKVNFVGPISNDEMDSYYQRSEGFLLPSKKETFGIVYAEALLNNTPILYSENTGFDKFFENVGPVVNPNSFISILKGLEDIIQNSEYYRNNIIALRARGAFDIFKPTYSKNVYLQSIQEITKKLSISPLRSRNKFIRILKLLTGFVAAETPVVKSFFIKKAAISFRIIYYHSVSPTFHPHLLNKPVPPEDFRNQLKYLTKKFKFITLSEAIELLKINESLNGCIALTTDDGFSDNFDTVAPILDEFKIQSTMFLINNCIDNCDMMWRNKIALIRHTYNHSKIFKIINELKSIYGLPSPLHNESLLDWSWRTFPMNKKDLITNHLLELSGQEFFNDYFLKHKPYMTSEQIQSLLSAGYEIGSHSLSHPNFSLLNGDEAEVEILNSINGLEEKFRVPVKFFSYPFGRRLNNTTETEIRNLLKGKLDGMLDVDTSLRNNRDPYKWGRDGMETYFYSSMFKFFIAPLFKPVKNHSPA